jgi:hypothetical protein
MMMRATFAGVIAAVAVCLAFAGLAHADPDPHIPDPQNNYCPGGGAGSMIYVGYCDGVPYPDGSYWHYIQYGIPLVNHPAGLLSPGMQCVVNNGSPFPAPAPPGGCGGAV